MQIKAVGFDLDDTLYDRYQVYRSAFEIMESAIIETKVPFKVFNNVFQKYSIIEYELFIEGKKERDDYKIDRVKSSYEYIGHQLSTEQAILFDALYEYYRGKISLRSKARETMIYLLENKYDVFILTNGPSRDQRDKLTTLGLDDIIPQERWYISDEISSSKPNSEIFKYIENDLKLKGEEILYIGDHLENDIIGSMSRNWQAVYYNITEEILGSENIKEFTEFNALCKWITSKM